MNRKWLLFLMSAALFMSSAFAGGAAAIVAQESRSKGYSYSIITRYSFLNECALKANESVCSCVLDHLQNNYSEEEFLQFENQEEIDPHFRQFIFLTTNECDSEFMSKNPNYLTARAREEGEFSESIEDNWEKRLLTLGEIQNIIAMYYSEKSQKEFTRSCSENPLNKSFGVKEVKKICACSIDKIKENKEKLEEFLSEEEIWIEKYDEKDSSFRISDDIHHFIRENYTNIQPLECYPEKFSSGFKKYLIKQMNDFGVPLTTAKCITNFLEKEYTVQSYLEFASQPNLWQMLFALPIFDKCFSL